MVHRYRAWVEGLTSAWNISRQRYFGVPFPVWYPVGDDGVVDFDRPIVPSEDRLPVDPTTDVPDGYDEAARDRPGGFSADPDIMDTWATSSITPQIAGGWVDDPDLFGRVFPMDLRPQAHDIIRTWLFTTVVRAELEHHSLPWSDVAISGWVLDPDRKKMSKSKGNVVTPLEFLERHGADAVRFWAAKGRPGTDTAIDEAQMKVGRRLAIKVLNASRFALGRLGEDPVPGAEAVTEPLDAAVLAALATTVAQATAALADYDYSRALDGVEAFFWSFCDDYLELVKSRAYGDPGSPTVASARAALALALSVQLRLLAPFLPFVTEEVWSWWHEEGASIHRERWPEPGELDVAAATEGTGVLEVAAEILSEVRKAKTTAKRSMRAEVARLEVVDEPARLEALAAARSDLLEAGHVAELVLTAGSPTAVIVELADEPADGAKTS